MLARSILANPRVRTAISEAAAKTLSTSALIAYSIFEENRQHSAPAKEQPQPARNQSAPSKTK